LIHPTLYHQGMKTLLSKTSAHSLLHHFAALVSRRLLLALATLAGRTEVAEHLAPAIEFILVVALLVAVEVATHKATHYLRARPGRNVTAPEGV
jgi:hypothetical protein